ncbi:MAG TPA: Tudor-knot domain-containing protein [Pyrinomonadaceae bacterium]|nr:Tudor-knot domain-containing protein [Pyrinomonadaceae bacterium]
MKIPFLILLSLLAFSGLACGQSARIKKSADSLAWNPSRTWVYFVGLLEWQDKDKFGSFPQKNRRDEILLNVLRQKGVPESQIVYLKDNAATIEKVKDSFPKFLQRSKDGDTVIVYFCGHGYKTDENKTTYLATYDVSNKTQGWRTDTIPADIEKYFKGSNAIILADNCYSGALAEDVKKLSNPRVSYAVMASTHFNSFSTANWTFTESLIYGFRGDSYFDENGDGKITLAELQENAEEDMLFGEEQVAEFEVNGNFTPNSIISLANKRNSSKRIGEHIEAYSVDGWYKGFIRDEKDGKYQVRYYGYEESDDEWVAPDNIRSAKLTQYPVGAKVNVNWLGKWFVGTVLEIKGSSHYITFDGFGKQWDEWTPSKRIKEISATELANSKLEFKAGDLIEARDSRKIWYRSKILAADNGKYKVHFFGWSEKWDEWVTPDRVRNSNDYDFGREVNVIQNGVWYKAILVDSRYGERLVSYIGYNEDEWVKDERIRELNSSVWSSNRYGKKVEVLSKGKWYQARILDQRNGEFYIHYEGYSDSWNEWVTSSRVREIR